MIEYKIAYITSRYPSLSETFIHREIQSLKKNNINVLTFALKRPEDLAQSEERRKASENTVYSRPDFNISGIFLLFYFILFTPKRFLNCLKDIYSLLHDHPVLTIVKNLGYLFAAITFTRILKKNKVKHIHAHFTTATTIALFCKRLIDIPFSFTAHASGDIYTNPTLLNSKMQEASFIISISEYNYHYLNTLTNYKYRSKIYKVYNGVEIPTINIKNRNLNETLKLISVGYFTYYKGYPILIEALNLLKKKGYNFQMTIIGDGPQRELIELLIKEYDLGKNVNIIGFAENSFVIKELNNADIFVLASDTYVNGIRDGMPTVCTEAMSYGLPVISTYISANPELIINGHTGLLVPEKDPLALAEALEKIFKNPELIKIYGENGYNRVNQHFNIDCTTLKLVQIFKNNIAL